MISLIHPSRGRPDKSFATVTNWLKKSGAHPTQTEVIVSVDASDPQLTRYIELHGKVLINNNTSVVEATNKAAEQAKGDILIYLSDDFDCPEGWWKLITDLFTVEPMLLKVDDCLQRFDVPVLTIPIMNRSLYERLGYFWHPGYKSMFCDEDLYWTAKKLGVLRNAEHLKFQHNHVSVGRAEDDETYRASAKNWDQGKAFFAQRKAQGFPL